MGRGKSDRSGSHWGMLEDCALERNEVKTLGLGTVMKITIFSWGAGRDNYHRNREMIRQILTPRNREMEGKDK